MSLPARDDIRTYATDCGASECRPNVFRSAAVPEHYAPEPYATIITRLGNAYGQAFFMNGACLCLASVLIEAAEGAGHPVSLKLILEEGLFLHHALVEVAVNDRNYSLDVEGPNAEHRYLSKFSISEFLVSAETARDRQPSENHAHYLASFIKQFGTDYHLEDFSGREDPSKSYEIIRRIGMGLEAEY